MMVIKIQAFIFWHLLIMSIACIIGSIRSWTLLHILSRPYAQACVIGSMDMCNREHLFFLLSGYKTNIIHSVFFLYIFSITFLFILLQSLHADTSSEVKGGGDRHINKKTWSPFIARFTALGAWELPTIVETSNSELHADMIYQSLYTRYAYNADTP